MSTTRLSLLPNPHPQLVLALHARAQRARRPALWRHRVRPCTRGSFMRQRDPDFTTSIRRYVKVFNNFNINVEIVALTTTTPTLTPTTPTATAVAAGTT